MAPSIKDAFLAGLPAQARSAWDAVEQLEETLTGLLAAAKDAWPDLSIKQDFYIRHLAERCEDAQIANPTFQHLNTKDLYLAAACLHTDPRAVIALEKHYLSQVPKMLISLKPSTDIVEETLQQLRFRLLTTNEGKQPVLRQYKGRGSLLVWLRVMAVRTALDLIARGKNPKQMEFTESNAEAQAAGDTSKRGAERMLLDARYRGPVQEALVAALDSLPAKQRTLLMLHYVDGQTLEAIGKIYATHKATVSRWLAQARDAVRDELRRLLQERLKLSPGEADSLADTLRSQLDLSLSKALKVAPSVA